MTEEVNEIYLRKARPDDLEMIIEIYNHEVEHGFATFDIHPKTRGEMMDWFMAHNVKNHPLLVAVDQSGNNERVMGYASLSAYRSWEAYDGTVELSIYVHPNDRNKHVATFLMREILELAKKDKRTHAVVSVITHGNEASERLHEKFGFTHCGTMKEVGIKWDQLLDVDHYELIVGGE